MIFSNSEYGRVISVGENNLVQIWQLELSHSTSESSSSKPSTSQSETRRTSSSTSAAQPSSHELGLSPLASFFLSGSPTHALVLHHRLFVSVIEPPHATQLVMHDLTTKDVLRHEASQNHTQAITALTCSPALRLYVSASMDASLKIWDERNRLVRH